VREWVNARLRALVRAGQDVVVDGRDIGTVPDARLRGEPSPAEPSPPGCVAN